MEAVPASIRIIGNAWRGMAARGVDVPDRGAATEEGLGDLGRESAGRRVGDVPDVVDRGDRASAGDHDVHRSARPLDNSVLVLPASPG